MQFQKHMPKSIGNIQYIVLGKNKITNTQTNKNDGGKKKTLNKNRSTLTHLS